MAVEPAQAIQERILLVGLGEIAKTHLAVLADIRNVAVSGGVDIALHDDLAFRGQPLPVYTSLDTAATRLSPTLVVVATPTATHATVCQTISRLFPDSTILVEKPVADNLVDARRLLVSHSQFPHLSVAYHFQHAPEVLWGLATAQRRHSQLGEPVAARAVFTDAYESDVEGARSRYGSSWLDSGINALSILSLFARITRRTSLRQLGEASWSTTEGRFRCQSKQAEFDALVVTSWHTTEAAKTTTIEYSSGAALIMDHTGVAGYLVHDGRVVDMFGTDGRVDRRYSHYSGLYHSYLSGSPRWPTGEDNLQLHELLLADP